MKDRLESMRVFMTGATGYIGGAVARALRRHGHEVAALVRPESESKDLRDDGVFIISGDLGSLPDLRETIENYDCVVHTAFSGKDAVAADKTAVDVFTKARALFVYTSGVWVFGNTGSEPADERSRVNPLPLVEWRPQHEQQALATGRSAVIRPGCVYGGKQSLLADWFAAAEQNRPLTIVGDGNNRWAMIELDEAAECYSAIVDQRATGVFHAVDDGTATLNDCVRAIASSASVEHVPLDVARQKMGLFAEALAVDQRVSSEETRRSLGWAPQRTFASSIEEQWSEWRSAQKAG